MGYMGILLRFWGNPYFIGLGGHYRFRLLVTAIWIIKENHMEKNMEDEMGTRDIEGGTRIM